jgi:hypothetical protein
LIFDALAARSVLANDDIVREYGVAAIIEGFLLADGALCLLWPCSSQAWARFSCKALLLSFLLFSSRLPGGGITFFAAAKKVIKESSFSTTPAACRR